MVPDKRQNEPTPTEPENEIQAIIDDLILRRQAGDPITDTEIIGQHPTHAEKLRRALHDLRKAESAIKAAHTGGSSRVSDGLSDETVIAGPKARIPEYISSLLPGYEILNEIHRGGQGVVYKAIQQSTNRVVAIKVMRDGRFSGSSNQTRFAQEVRILTSLRNPRIVTLHDCELGEDFACFIMEFVDGIRFDEYIRQEALTADQIVASVIKICEAVNIAHERGITHRDLKPSNILVDTTGEPHVLDFGLAKITNIDEFGSDQVVDQTVTGQFVGTLQWSSPEQVEGNPGEIGPATDVHALGVLLYNALSGTFPFQVHGNIHNITSAIVNEAPSTQALRLAKVPSRLIAIVLHCLEKSPDRRYQSAGELQQDLERLIRNEPVHAKRTGLRQDLAAQFGARWPLIIGSILIIAALIGGRLLLLSSDPADSETDSAAAIGENPDNHDALHLVIVPRRTAERGELDRILNEIGVSDPDSAIEEIQRLLTNRPSPRRRPRLLEQLGIILDHQGEWDQAKEAYLASLDLLERKPSRTARARVLLLAKLGALHEAMDEVKQAEERFEESLRTIEELDARHRDRLMVLAATDFGAFLVNSKRIEEARQMLVEAQAAAERINEPTSKRWKEAWKRVSG